MDPQDTRSRLLDVAGQIFAERGVKAATIRDIVQQAGANQAAVNYHFGDKEGLYAAVIEQGIRHAFERVPFHGGVGVEAPPEQRLDGVVQGMLRRYAGQDRSHWHGRILAREMEQPSQTFLEVIDRCFTPLDRLLQEIVVELNPNLSPEEIWMHAHSIIGQCTFYCKTEAILERTQPAFARLSLEERIARVGAHIVRFSLGGLRGGLA